MKITDSSSAIRKLAEDNGLKLKINKIAKRFQLKLIIVFGSFANRKIEMTGFIKN